MGEVRSAASGTSAAGPDGTAPGAAVAATPRAAAGLTAREVSKSFVLGGRELAVLRGVSFHLQAAETLAVVGPSGSGKSTLLHVLGTLERPTAGAVTLAGSDLYSLPEEALARLRNERIGFVFQDHYLLPQYSLLENVLMPALAFRREWAGARQRGAELLARGRLADRLRHRPAAPPGA